MLFLNQGLYKKGRISIETLGLEALQNVGYLSIIRFAELSSSKEEMKKQELLNEHPYKIWQGKNGDWYTYLPDKDKGRVQRQRKTKEEIEKAIIDYWKKEEDDPRIEDIFIEWNDKKLKLHEIAEPTHLRNKQVFARHFSTAMCKRRIKTISPEDFAEWIEEEIAEKELTNKAYANLRTVVIGILKRAKKRKFINFGWNEVADELEISKNTFKKVVKEDNEEVFDDFEFNTIIDYLEKNLDVYNLALLIMFITGVRVGEVVTLKHEDIVDNVVHVHQTESRVQRDGKYYYTVKSSPKTDAGDRRIVVSDDFSWILKETIKFNPFGEYIFTETNGERMTTCCVRSRLKTVCKKLGIQYKSTHKIRKTYASILLDNNIDKNLIMQQMGHTDLSITEKYYHRDRKSMDKKTKIINSIPDFQRKKSS